MDADAFLREVARIDDLPPLDDELKPGDQLAHFTIGARLGAGSMGAVYEAVDDKLGRTVAIKIIRRTNDMARARFLQEARAAAAVSHRNLVTVYEVGEASGRSFIVMERIRGKTLRGIRGDMEMVRAIADGLAAVHAAGIVHRDLKPDNVMLADDGTVKLLDFGIARIGTSSAERMTGSGMVVGTPSYMSPEQANAGETDARSDVYSFGVLATELLTGARPRLGDKPKWPVLARCLAADPAARYADARDVARALANPRRRWPYALVAFGVIATVIAWWPSHHASTHRLIASESVRTRNPEARAAYRGAFQSLHDAQFFEAVRGFERAVELDPAFAAAHLRLGLAKRWFHSQEEGRRSFAVAVQQRELLDDRDRALLDAAEPAVMRSPYDYAESEKRFKAALARFPDDSELLYWLGYAYSELGQQDRLSAIATRLSKIDPTAAVAWSARAMTAFYLGNLREAREDALECRRVAPTQGTCAFELQKILDDTGACSELETTLRAWAIASPDEPRPLLTLSRLLLVNRRPASAVEDAFSQALARMPEAQRADAIASHQQLLAWYAGDFAKVSPSDVVEAIDVALETGDTDAARAAAQTYLAKRDSEPQSHGTSDADLFSDPLGYVLSALVHTGGMSRDEARRRRDAWVRELDASIGGLYKRHIWAHAYAGAVFDKQDALQAMIATPRYVPLPRTYWFQQAYGRIGRTLLLADRRGAADWYLQRATKRCLDLDPRDFLALGLVGKANDDWIGACDAFKTVLAYWGAAKPRSITADRARHEMAVLPCDSLRQ